MIWKTIHITAEGLQGKEYLRKQIGYQSDVLPHSNSTFTVCIVGGGPKGLYALEELFHRIKDEEILGEWNILWFNDTDDFGCGHNYQVDQPDFLLINYCIGHVDAWDRSRSTSKTFLSLLDWVKKFKAPNSDAKPTDFASRALVGHYLQYVAMQVVASKPSNVQLSLISEKVRNIESEPDGRLLLKTRSNKFISSNVLLTTGHCYRNLPLIDFPEDTVPENYIVNPYPVEVLNKIPSKTMVGIIGWGLTFIDVALQLTEGRGGYFDKNNTYIPSGKEPVLLPFSRNQLPAMPRGPIYGKNVYKLHYLNEKWFAEMRTIQTHRKIDFQTEIFPWLIRELNFSYYSTQLQNREPSVVEAYILSLSEKERFSYQDLLFPKVPNAATPQDSYISYLEFLIAESDKGALRSPLMAAASVWREAGTMIANLYRSGGFTGESQRYLDQELFAAFSRTSYGPPIENMKKIKALMIAGVIQVQSEAAVEVTWKEDGNQFVLQSGENRKFVEFIVDARIARPNLPVHNSELYKNLSKDKLVKPYENDAYQPGCIAMDTAGKVLNDQTDIPLYAYGSNTEGFLLDNDSLSRKKNNLAPAWAAAIAQQYISVNGILSKTKRKNFNEYRKK